MINSGPKPKQLSAPLIAVLCLLLFGLFGYLGWRQLEKQGIIKAAPTRVLPEGGGSTSMKIYELCKERGGSKEECLLEAIPGR